MLIFSGEIGTFPTRDEFCNSTLGTAIMKNAMTCPIHQETHEMYSHLFYEMMLNSTNATWIYDYDETYVRQGKQLKGNKQNGNSGKKPYKHKGPMDADFGKRS